MTWPHAWTWPLCAHSSPRRPGKHSSLRHLPLNGIMVVSTHLYVELRVSEEVQLGALARSMGTDNRQLLLLIPIKWRCTPCPPPTHLLNTRMFLVGAVRLYFNAHREHHL